MLLRSKPPLQIHPTPFKPSLLSITPSPFSPLTPLPRPRTITTSTSTTRNTTPPPTSPNTTTPPPSPLSWMWQCHHCSRTYALGTTRRCLDDGHLFCSGTTTIKKWREPVVNRRVKRHKACASEFDYAGWKGWGRWRRGGIRRRSTTTENEGGSGNGGIRSDGGKKDCWNTCDYPSECRWGRSVGIHTPSPSTPSFPHALKSPISLPPPPPAEENVCADPDLNLRRTQSGYGNKDFFTTLLASAKRRKSSHVPSPLAAPPSPSTDSDGDVETSAAAAPATVGSVAMDMLKDVILGRKAVRRGKDAVPMLTVGKTIDVEMEGVESGNVEGDGDVDMEMAPLVRVGSRN